MKYRITIYGLVLIVLTFTTMPLFAIQTRGMEPVLIKDNQGKQVGLYKESHALVIGASQYTNGWPKLPGVKNDVQMVGKILKEHGFEALKYDRDKYLSARKKEMDIVNKSERENWEIR
ncbi:MAG: caspase family protein [Candidatus Scalindua sp.]